MAHLRGGKECKFPGLGQGSDNAPRLPPACPPPLSWSMTSLQEAASTQKLLVFRFLLVGVTGAASKGAVGHSGKWQRSLLEQPGTL